MDIVNIHEWPYGYFEYSWRDVIGILNTHEVTLWKYSEADVMGILKFIFKITRLLLNIQNTHAITSRIFKIPVSLWIFKISMSHSKLHFFWILKILMTSLQEYSKIPMTSAFEYSHDVTLWIFKKQWRHLMNIQNASWVIWIFECWRYGYFENSWSDVIGLEYSWSNLSIYEVRSTVI